jgi:hypothetical protein
MLCNSTCPYKEGKYESSFPQSCDGKRREKEQKIITSPPPQTHCYHTMIQLLGLQVTGGHPIIFLVCPVINWADGAVAGQVVSPPTAVAAKLEGAQCLDVIYVSTSLTRAEPGKRAM